MDAPGNILGWLAERLGGEGPNWGVWWVFIGAVLDAGLFPVFVETVLIPPLLFQPDRWPLFAVVFLAGTLVGAAIAYWLGVRAGGGLADWLIPDERREELERLVRENGLWAAGLAEIGPIPFITFPVVAGTSRLPFLRMLGLVAVVRGVRYGVFAGLLVTFGQPLWELLEGHPWLAGLALILYAAALFYSFWWKPRKELRAQHRERAGSSG
jgi:membrane protein YqaA with SNARE-associated domain